MTIKISSAGWALVAVLFALSLPNVHGQVRGEFLITNYGAKGDYAFDNAPIINDLIANLPDSGGSIVIPHGNFLINSPIVVDKSFVTIRGLGGGSRLVVAGEAGEGILVPGGAPRLSGFTVRDLEITGANWDIPRVGIYLDRANDGTHFNALVCTNLQRGIFVREGDAFRIVGCSITNCESALQMLLGFQGVVNRNHFAGFSGGQAVQFEGMDRVQFTGNVIMPDGAVALKLIGVDSFNVSGNTITTFYTGAIEVAGNMNSFSGNNITAVLVDGEWLADPRSRDNLWGLVRIEGNDNTFTSTSIMSWQPVNDVRINVLNGDRNILRDLTIAANGSNKKISVHPSTRDTRITHCGVPSEIQLNGNSSARVRFDP